MGSHIQKLQVNLPDHIHVRDVRGMHFMLIMILTPGKQFPDYLRHF